jgi:hypothetical protein
MRMQANATHEPACPVIGGSSTFRARQSAYRGGTMRGIDSPSYIAMSKSAILTPSGGSVMKAASECRCGLCWAARRVL